MLRTMFLAGLLAMTVAAPTLAAADPWKDESGDRSAYRIHGERSDADWRRGYEEGRRDARRDARGEARRGDRLRDDRWREAQRNDRWREGQGDGRLYDRQGRRRLDWEDQRRRGDEGSRGDDDRRRYEDEYRRDRRDGVSPADILIPLLTR